MPSSRYDQDSNRCHLVHPYKRKPLCHLKHLKTFHYLLPSFSSPMATETHSSLNSQRKKDEDLKGWDVKARMISRENTISRRFSSSYITSFREDACKSFRSNFTISSTASSPGYTRKGINTYLV